MKIRCNKCGDAVNGDKRSMWSHAITKHWDEMLQRVGGQILSADDEQGLYGIGERLGKQMQADGITGAHVASAIWKGLSRGKN
jgi:hypothetical protein